MADGLGKKVDMIWNKLRKLDSIPTEMHLHNLHKSMASLEQSFAVMEKDVQNLKDKTGKTNTKVNDLEKSVEFHNQDIGDLQKFRMKPTSSKCNSYTRDITGEGRVSCLLESKKMVHRSTPKTRRRITTWKIQGKWFMIFCKESLALRMPKVDSNFRGFTEWEKEQVRSPVPLS